MFFGILRYRAVQPVLLTAILSSFLTITFLLGSARQVFAQEPTTIKIPHEVTLSGMLVLDLNGDGKEEIITASKDGYLTVVDGATLQVIWDKNIADYMPGYTHTRMQSTPSAADLDNDGQVEIVVATGGADPLDSDGPGAIVVLNYVGGGDYFQLKAGWPVFALDELGSGRGSSSPDGTPDGFYSTPSLGDIDGDGTKEIVIGGMDRRLHAYRYDGTEMPGWPLGRNYNIWRESRSTAALADLDGDGILDILIGTNNYSIPYCANPYLFYGLKGNTLALDGFPFSTTQNIESSPAIGDINGDGSPDIVFGTGDFNENCGQKSDGKKVYAIDRFGKLLPGWPVTTNANMINSPALGDLDNDGTPEVVIHTNDTLYAWHGDGSSVQGFPVHGEYTIRHASPLLVDIDGDSQVEIVLASGQIYGPTGQLERQREYLQGQLVVTDQDGDGLLETIGVNHYNYDKGWQLNIYLYQESGSAKGAMPWPMFHRSLDRNGNLPFLYSLSGRVVDESNNGVADVTLTLDSGQTAVTDDQGNYVFGSLPPADYTVTPSHQYNPFTPNTLSVSLSNNATLATLVMMKPIYDVTGKVMNANGSPLRGVTMQLSGNATQKTGADGTFSFEGQAPGKYTLTPISPNLHYLPAERGVNAESQIPQLFYALPQPVTKPLQPDASTVINFKDTQGLPTTITFPDGLGAGPAVITPLITTQPPDYMPTGHTMEIAVTGATESTQSMVVGQGGEPLSIEIKIQYNEADLRSMLEAEELVLLWKSPAGWVNAQAHCPSGSSSDLNLAQKTITVAVCQWGTYGLFAPVDQIFMPALGVGK
jgi:hypothetical protein